MSATQLSALQILDNSIMDVDIASNAAIAQSKISNLVSDLSGKASTTALDGKRAITEIGDAHGWVLPPNANNFTISNTGSSVTVTVLIGAGAFKINGTAFTARQMQITFTANLGQNFIYCGLNAGVPTLYSSFSSWSILDLANIPVCTVNWDGTTAILADELHLASRNLIQHQKEHEAEGARYISGLTTVFASGATNTFSSGSGRIRDEERSHDIAAKTTCMIGYRNSAQTAMVFDAVTTRYAKLVSTTTGAPYYDLNGTLTALGVGQYGCYYFYGTNRKLPTDSELVSIMGQGSYNSVALAQTAPSPTLAGMSVAEWRILYRVIVRNVGGALSYVQADDLRLTTTGLAVSGSGVATPTAAGTSFSPEGSIIATNVQSAIVELDTAIAGIETLLAAL